jgi:hypothetical protein
MQSQKKMKMFSSLSTACFISLSVSLAAFFTLSCGTTLQPIEPVETRYITFQCDSVINGGKNLSVDIIYITYVQELQEVTRLGPGEWFRAEKREQWKFKESVVLKGGDEAVVKLDPLILERTVLLVIFADYSGGRNPGDQQVVIDFAGKESEIIEVQKSRLQPRNVSLRYVK